MDPRTSNHAKKASSRPEPPRQPLTGRKAIYWVTVCVFVVAGAGLTSLPGIFKQLFQGTPTVASVNGLPIHLGEYRERVRRIDELLGLYRQHFGIHYKKFVAQYLGNADRPTDIALEELITEKLTLYLAHELPLTLSDSYITRELSKPAALQALLGDIAIRYLFSEQGVLNCDMLRRYVASRGFSLQDFEAFAEERLAGQFATLLCQESAYASPARFEREILRSYCTRHFEILTIDLAGALLAAEQKISVTEAELADYFELRNRTARAYWSPERRSGTAWRFELSSFQAQPEQAVPDSGSPGANIFIRSAEEVLSSPNPKQFKSFIEEHRGHKLSINRVALAGHTSPSKNSDPLATELFSLEELHDRTAITKKEYGYIIELTDIAPREPIDFEDVREEVLSDLRASRVARKAQELLASSSPTPHATRKTISLAPLPLPEQARPEQALPEQARPDKAQPGLVALEELGLRRESLDRLIHPGDSQAGITSKNQAQPGSAYRIVLLSCDKQPLSEVDRRSIERSLYSESRTLLMRVLIASLRGHAILVNNTHIASQAMPGQAPPGSEASRA